MSNTVNNNSVGFEMKDILDFLAEMGSNGSDILDNAKEIETVLEEGFEWILDGDRLKDMGTSIKEMFTELAARPNLINMDFLAQIVQDMEGKIEEAIGVPITNFDQNFSEVLKKMKEMLPNDLKDENLKNLKDQVESIIDKVSDTGISVRVLTDNPALTAETPSVKTPLEQRSTSAEQTPPPDGEFDKILKDFFETNQNLTDKLDLLVVDIKKAIADSSIMLEIEDHLLSIKGTLTETKPLTLEVFFTEFANLTNAVGTQLLAILEKIIELIVSAFKKIYNEVEVNKDKFSAPITNLVNLLNLGQIQTPGIYTIPSILVSIPVTIGFKIAQTGVPGFPSFPQAYSIHQHPKFYGSNQIADGVMALIFGGADLKLKENSNKRFWFGLVEKIWTLMTGAIAQLTSVPDFYISSKDVNEKDFPTKIWEYQWFQGVLVPFILMVSYVFQEKIVDDDRKKKWMEFSDPLIVLTLELIHLVLFIIQYEKERTEDEEVLSRDKRVGAASIIDPLPNIIGSLFSIYRLTFDPFNDPVSQGDIIISSIEKIIAKVEAEGEDSIGKKLTDQRAKLISTPSTEGALRTAFKNANNHFVGDTNGKIKFEVNEVEELLTKTEEGTLAYALSDLLNNKLNITSIGTNEQDFKSIEDTLGTFQEPIGACNNKITEVNFMIPNLDEAWNDVKKLESLTSSSNEVKSVERKIKSFKNDLASAARHINDIDKVFKKFHPKNEYLDIAKRALNPNSLEQKTIGKSLQNARTVLTAFQEPLKQKVVEYKKLLDQIKTYSDQGAAMNTLVDDLDPQNTNGLIGSKIEKAKAKLDSFKTPLEAMIAENENNSSAISQNITNVQNHLQNSKNELNHLQEPLDTIIDGQLKTLSSHALGISDALNKKNNAKNLLVYGKLLRDSEVTSNTSTHGINKIKDDFSNELESAIKEAKGKIEEFVKEFKKVLEYVKATDTKLSDAISALEEIPNLTAKFNDSVTGSDIEKLYALGMLRKFDKKAAAILTPLKAAKTNLDLIEQTGLVVTNKANGIINSVGDGSSFINTIKCIKSSLSTGGSVGQKLEDIYGKINFSQATQDELKRPLKLVQELIGEMNNIRSSVDINNDPLKKELSNIDKGLIKIQKIGNKKESRKKVENSKFFIWVPMALTASLKGAYGGLMWDVGLKPAPIFEDFEFNPKKLTLTTTITGEYNTLTWEKEEEGVWTVIDDQSQPSLPIVWEYLVNPIRVKVTYAHGYAKAEPKAIPIILTNNQEASNDIELAEEDNIANHKFGTLSGDSNTVTFFVDPNSDFQINKSNEISLKKPISTETPLNIIGIDNKNNFYQKTYTIKINPAPSDIQLALTEKEDASETFEIAEMNNNKGFVLGMLSATDDDAITFDVKQKDNFVIDSNTNKISLLERIEDSAQLEVTASDGKSITSKTYTININKAPKNIEIELTEGAVSIPEPTTSPNTIEITLDGNKADLVIGSLKAEDEGDDLTFSVDKTNDFAISTNNSIGELKLIKPIDDGTELVIRASDTAGNFTERTFIFEIL